MPAQKYDVSYFCAGDLRRGSTALPIWYTSRLSRAQIREDVLPDVFPMVGGHRNL